MNKVLCMCISLSLALASEIYSKENTYNNTYEDESYDNEASYVYSMPYRFSWAVKDDATKNDYSHQATSDGNAVTGSYRVLLPDGRTQIVTYRADENGYVADVKYEGEAKYPIQSSSRTYAEKSIAKDTNVNSSYGTHAYSSAKPDAPAESSYINKPSYGTSATYSENATYSNDEPSYVAATSDGYSANGRNASEKYAYVSTEPSKYSNGLATPSYAELSNPKTTSFYATEYTTGELTYSSYEPESVYSYAESGTNTGLHDNSYSTEKSKASDYTTVSFYSKPADAESTTAGSEKSTYAAESYSNSANLNNAYSRIIPAYVTRNTSQKVNSTYSSSQKESPNSYSSPDSYTEEASYFAEPSAYLNGPLDKEASYNKPPVKSITEAPYTTTTTASYNDKSYHAAKAYGTRLKSRKA